MVYHTHATHHRHPRGKFFSWIALILALGNAAFWTIWPNALEKVLGSEEYVGLVFSSVHFIIFIASLFAGIIFTRYERAKISRMAMLFAIICYFIFIFAQSAAFIIPLDIVRNLTVLLIGMAISLYVRDFAEENELGREEGRYFLYSNAGWFIGPIIGGVLAFISNSAVFLFTGLMYLIAYLLFRTKKIDPKVNKEKEHPFQTFKRFFASSNRTKSYIIYLGMFFWWQIYYIYVPLFLYNKGYASFQIGLVLSFTILPLMLLEQKTGVLADKYGVGKYLPIGFFGLSLFCLSFLIPNAFTVAVMMIFCNIAAACIEPLKDFYFYKNTPVRDEEKFLGILHSARPVAFFTAPLIASFFLSFFGESGVWVSSAIILAGFGFFSLSVKDQKK